MKNKPYSFYLLLVSCILLVVLTACNNNNLEPAEYPVFVVTAGGLDSTDGITRYSYDGITWLDSDMTRISQNYYLNGLVFGEGHFIGVGTGVYTFQSTDGIAWNISQLDSNKTLYDIALGEYEGQSPWAPYYVAVGQSGRVIYSSDYGATWTKGVSGISQTLLGVAFGNTMDGLSMFVAVGVKPLIITGGSGITIIYSITAGQSWIKYSINALNRDLFCVAFGNGRFIAAGDEGSITYSTNGAAWSLATSNTSRDIYGIAYGIANNSPIWVAVGQEGRILYSQNNGQTWTEQIVDVDKNWESVVCGNNMFVAVGYGRDGGFIGGFEGKIIYSLDGITWNTANTFAGKENNFTDIAYRY